MHDLRAVLEQERISRFHLMTFSRGTSWALELALDDPSRVETLSIGDYQAIEKRLTTAFVESLMQTSFRGRPMAERMEHHVLERLAAESPTQPLGSLGGANLPVASGSGRRRRWSCHR